MIVSFTMENGRATGFEVRDAERQHGGAGNPGTVARGACVGG